MSRVTADDQLRFLLSCVRYANNGKVTSAQSTIQPQTAPWDANKSRWILLQLHKSVVLFPKGQRKHTQGVNAFIKPPNANTILVPNDMNVS